MRQQLGREVTGDLAVESPVAVKRGEETLFGKGHPPKKHRRITLELNLQTRGDLNLRMHPTTSRTLRWYQVVRMRRGAFVL